MNRQRPQEGRWALGCPTTERQARRFPRTRSCSNSSQLGTTMKVFNTSLALVSRERTEVSDVTELVRAAVRRVPVGAGIALVTTLHTTCALFVNEFQSALIDDFKALFERLVPERNGYRHDDCRISDCERGNAHAHLRAAFLGQSVTLAVNDGELTLGRYQSVIFAELDGPRKREISIQIIGE
jgi:secondary thiamine-phosphate synthase enzyme